MRYVQEKYKYDIDICFFDSTRSVVLYQYMKLTTRVLLKLQVNAFKFWFFQKKKLPQAEQS